VDALTQSAKLTRRDIYGSLVFLVRRATPQLSTGLTLYQIGIPYVRNKLHNYFERLGGGIDRDLFGDDEAAPDLSHVGR
jgi:hypothetical protein